jgi:hypothetical protein
VKHKNAVIQALIAGEISSSEAIAQFRVLDADIEDRLRAAMKMEHPDMSDEDLVYWNLLGFVRSSCVSRPDGPQILARLARDWEQEKLHRFPRN